MDTTLRTVDTIKALQRSTVDDLTSGGSIFVGYPHVAATEGDVHLERNHLVMEDASDHLLGILPTYLLRETGSWEHDPFVRYVAHDDDSPENKKNWYPILLGGASPGYASDLTVHPRLNAADRVSVARSLLRGFEDLAARLGARSAGLMYLNQRSVAILAPHLGDRAAVLWSGGDAAISVKWDSFASYLSWLPRKRRKEVRREIRKFDSAGFEVFTADLGDCYEQIAPLAGNLKRRYGSTAHDAYWIEFFASYAAELNDLSTVFLCRRDGDVVAFSLLCEWEGVVYVRACGFDYDRAGSHAEYFNLCYYMPLRLAMERGASVVHLGMDTYDAKVSRGAKLEALWSVVLGPKRPATDWKTPLSSLNTSRLERYESTFGPYAVEELWAGGSRPDDWESLGREHHPDGRSDAGNQERRGVGS